MLTSAMGSPADITNALTKELSFCLSSARDPFRVSQPASLRSRIDSVLRRGSDGDRSVEQPAEVDLLSGAAGLLRCAALLDLAEARRQRHEALLSLLRLRRKACEAEGLPAQQKLARSRRMSQLVLN